MAETPSTRLLRPGTPLPPFTLPDASGRMNSFDGRNGRPTVIIFACNHCPYVIHLAQAIGAMAKEFAGRADFFAINSNDVEKYPQDGREHMPAFTAAHGWDFPYLLDESQEIALAYGAACTPDFFVADAQGRLFYCGQFDDSRPPKPGRPSTHVDGRDLRAALEAALAGSLPPENQFPSTGCNIKWRPGREPIWFPVRKEP